MSYEIGPVPEKVGKIWDKKRKDLEKKKPEEIEANILKILSEKDAMRDDLGTKLNLSFDEFRDNLKTLQSCGLVYLSQFYEPFFALDENNEPYIVTNYYCSLTEKSKLLMEKGKEALKEPSFQKEDKKYFHKLIHIMKKK